jgi:hypothetical protein
MDTHEASATIVCKEYAGATSSSTATCTRRKNPIGAVHQLAFEQTPEGEDLPSLLSYVTGWKFWCHFAVGPFIFLTLNGFIISTLVAFDEYQFRHGYTPYDPYSYCDRTPSNAGVQFEMNKRNRLVSAVLLLIDALIMYRSVIFLEQKVRELDMISETADEDRHHQQERIPANQRSSSDIQPNVHAIVSRKVDVVLGRGPQPRVSIFVSVLWLLYVLYGTIGIVSLAEWVTLQVCTKSFTGFFALKYDHEFYLESSRNSTHRIDKIPDELQDWAVRKDSPLSSPSTLIHLSNGATYFLGSPATKNDAPLDNSILFSTGADGTLRSYPNVFPRGFISVAGADEWNSDRFCCEYSSALKSSALTTLSSDYHQFRPEISTSLLCVTLSDNTTSGVFPNVTLYDPAKKGDRKNPEFVGVSLAPYNNGLWVRLVFDSLDGMFHLEFYNIGLDNTLQLNFVTKASVLNDNYDWRDDPYMKGPLPSCYDWTAPVVFFGNLLLTISASTWLLRVKKLSAGAVPACALVSFFISICETRDGVALRSLAAGVAFFGSLGCVPISIDREKLIWFLYTMLASVARAMFAGRSFVCDEAMSNFESALWTIVVASMIGFVLNHPVLYLFCWVGGVWAIYFGAFLSLFSPLPLYGLFAIGLGVLLISACVPLGSALIQHRSFLLYCMNRACTAMFQFLLTRDRPMTAPRYTLVASGPPISTV